MHFQSTLIFVMKWCLSLVMSNTTAFFKICFDLLWSAVPTLTCFAWRSKRLKVYNATWPRPRKRKKQYCKQQKKMWGSQLFHGSGWSLFEMSREWANTTACYSGKRCQSPNSPRCPQRWRDASSWDDKCGDVREVPQDNNRWVQTWLSNFTTWLTSYDYVWQTSGGDDWWNSYSVSTVCHLQQQYDSSQWLA